MKRISSKKPSRGWILTLALASLSVVYVVLVFLPSQAKVRHKRKEYQAKQLFVLQSSRLTSAIVNTEKELEAARAFTVSSRSSTAQPTEVTQLLGKLTAQADALNIQVIRLERQTPVQLQTLGRIPVEFVCQGDMNSVTADWTQLQTPQDCDVEARIYCFQVLP